MVEYAKLSQMPEYFFGRSLQKTNEVDTPPLENVGFSKSGLCLFVKHANSERK